MGYETRQRRMWAVATLLVGLMLAGVTHAQTAPIDASANLHWVNATQGCVGTVCTYPLTGADALTKVQVFAAIAPISATTTATPTAELPPTATAFTYTVSVTNGSTLYFRVRDCSQVCGEFGDQVTKLVQVIVPGKPTGVTVTVSVTVSVVPQP
jgi:hypothetical protein